MMPYKKIKKILDKLLKEEGISGYSIDGQKIVIYLETEAMKAAINMALFDGYDVEFKTVGRFQAL